MMTNTKIAVTLLYGNTKGSLHFATKNALNWNYHRQSIAELEKVIFQQLQTPYSMHISSHFAYRCNRFIFSKKWSINI